MASGDCIYEKTSSGWVLYQGCGSAKECHNKPTSSTVIRTVSGVIHTPAESDFVRHVCSENSPAGAGSDYKFVGRFPNGLDNKGIVFSKYIDGSGNEKLSICTTINCQANHRGRVKTNSDKIKSLLNVGDVAILKSDFWTASINQSGEIIGEFTAALYIKKAE